MPTPSNEYWGDLHSYAEAAAELKIGATPTDVQVNAVRDAFDLAVTTVYRAVAVDVDGTLTPSGSVDLHLEVANSIASLVRRGVPVLLVTGRGHSVHEDIIQPILQLGQISDASARRLWALIRNGTCLWRPDLGEEVLHTVEFNGEALAAHIVGPLGINCDPKVRSGTIRLQFRTTDELDLAAATIASAGEALSSLAGSDGELAITQAAYGVRPTLDLSILTKNQGLEIVADRLGIDPGQIVRIGDRGDAEGNDYHVLNCAAGFTVGQFSEALDRCHIAIDPATGTQLLAAAGTSFLLEGMFITPPIRVAGSGFPHHRRQLALAEQAGRLNGELQDAKFSGQLNRSIFALSSHSVTGSGLAGAPNHGLSDVFDRMLGAVRFRDDELQLLSVPLAHPACQLFQLDRLIDPDPEPKTRMAMFTNNGVILRGPAYYFGLVVPRGESRVSQFLEQASSFVASAAQAAVALDDGPADLSRFKLLIGIADNVRNILLQAAYLGFVVESRSNGTIVQVGAREETVSDPIDNLIPGFAFTRGVIRLAVEHTRLMYGLLFDNKNEWESALGSYADFLGQLRDATDVWPAESIVADADEAEDDVFRSRECDWFAQNVAGVDLGLRKHRDNLGLQPNMTVLAVGLPYGGIELPVIAAALAPLYKLDIVPSLLEASVYQDKSRGDRIRQERARVVADLNDQDAAMFMDRPTTSAVVSLLMDDNSTTGSTLEWAHDLLVARGMAPQGAVVIRYPTLNRRRHMEMDDHGFPDSLLLHSFITGLVGPPPYTRLQEANPSRGKDVYKNQRGVFDRSKERLKLILEANGTPAEGMTLPTTTEDSS